MASTNQTAHLGLSQWVSEDCPKMDDFNQDNQKVDTALYQHTADQTAHLTQAQAQWLAKPLTVGSYQGNGSLRRVITLDAAPRFVMVGVANDSPYQYDPVLQYAIQRFAMLTGSGASNGIEAAENGFAVYQSMGVPAAGGTFISLNEDQVNYWYIALL